MIGDWNDDLLWDDAGYWDSAGSVSALGTSVLRCCGTVQGATAVALFGESSFDADVRRDGDGLARYYPLYLNLRDVQDAMGPPIDENRLAAMRVIGRDIAFGIDAGASGELVAGRVGVLCEVTEQLRGGRSYDIPDDVVLSPQPSGREQAEIPLLQWDLRRGFTASVWFRRFDIRREQTLFTVGDGVRVGLSWLGELVLELFYADGSVKQEWSSSVLPVDALRHVALAFDPGRGDVRVYLAGVLVIMLPIEGELAALDSFTFGRWRGGSLLWGDAQDLRIYQAVKSAEFIAAESDSFCADWVEVL